MDNHPIPQDVTGFQFKLIGDMTVKQFAYLASGAVLAWIFFILPLNILIRLPVSIAFASIGAALAFLPVGGRPLDTMMLRFIEAVFSPNQYVYDKQGGRLLVNHLHLSMPPRAQTTQLPVQQDDKLNRFLQALPQKPKTPLDQKENDRFNSILSTLGNTPTTQLIPITQSSQTMHESPIQIISRTPAPSPQFVPDHPYIVSMNPLIPDQKIEKKPVIEDQKPIQHHQEHAVKQPLPLPKEEATPNLIPSSESLQKQLSELLLQKKEFDKRPSQPLTQQVMVQTPQAPAAPPKQIPRSAIPFAPDAPNVIAGIIKDSRGNVLPNILVEVKDKEGNPVRAFKTNTLGQFASATPLLNGTYAIEFEDTQNTHRFNTLEVQAEGELIPILEVISTDQREDLRKSLFGST